MPAMIWISPPNASASGITTGSPPAGSSPALIRLSSTVVSPKPTSPNAAGLASGAPCCTTSVITLSLAMPAGFGLGGGEAMVALSSGQAAIGKQPRQTGRYALRNLLHRCPASLPGGHPKTG